MCGIVNFLCKRNAVIIKNRFDDFNDEEFMNYLSENNLYLLLGSQFILKNRDYKITEKFKKFIQDYREL